MSESAVIQKIKNDPSAFAEIFRLYYIPIFGYILRRTGNFDDSADIAADTFFKAFSHIHAFNYRGISIKVWLYRIATNEVNLYFRLQKKYKSIFDGHAMENEAVFKTYFQEDREEMTNELERHTQFIQVLGALRELPLKYQDVISLRYFEGKDNREIAGILNMNEGTLKSLLSRGLEKLRKICNQL